MTIKIQCPCGVKYAFEVAPENARNPVRFVCQQCGLDSSAAVNQIIQQTFATQIGQGATPAATSPAAPQPPAAGPVRLKIHLASEKPVAAEAAPAQPSTTETPEAEPAASCLKHA